MTDTAITAISGTRRQIRELVDGTIEVKLHIDPRFKAEFHRLFPEIDMPVALAPLQPDFESGQAVPEKEKAVREEKPYGKQASLLYKVGFFLNPKVLAAIGSDSEYLEWVRQQPCAITGEFDYNKDEATGETRERCEAAHYRSIEGGAGTGIKPQYSAIPLLRQWHMAQTADGYAVFVGRLRNRPGMMDAETAGRIWMEKKSHEYLEKWASHKLAQDYFTQRSIGYVNPRDLRKWADEHGVYHWLPQGYR